MRNSWEEITPWELLFWFDSSWGRGIGYKEEQRIEHKSTGICSCLCCVTGKEWDIMGETAKYYYYYLMC